MFQFPLLSSSLFPGLLFISRDWVTFTLRISRCFVQWIRFCFTSPDVFTTFLRLWIRFFIMWWASNTGRVGDRISFYQHRRMAYTAFWTKAPPGKKKIFQMEQPVMVMKPSLSIHIELYIIFPFPNNKYWRTFLLFLSFQKRYPSWF